MIKYVIFDMDGTLFDTEPYFERSWSETGERWGLVGMREMYYSQAAGRSIDIVKQLLKEIYGVDFDSECYFADRWVQFKCLVSNGVEEKPGCYELLTFLKKKGIRTALATSTPKDIAELYLYKSRIPEYLDAVVFGNEVERGKPHPDIFLEAGRRIGAVPEKTIVVGDSSFDMIGGHRAGMRPVMVIDHNPPSDEARPLCHAVHNSLFEVIDLVNNENKTNVGGVQ